MKKILLFVFLIYMLNAQMIIHLSPELLSLARNETVRYARNSNQHMFNEIFPDATTMRGVASSYYLDNTTNPTCNIPPATLLATVGANYGVCFKNVISNQPNCSIIYQCLLNSGGSFQQYSDCLVPDVFLYTTVSPINESSYIVYLYVDDICTIPFSFFSSLSVPFGCLDTGLMDENGNLCNVTQNIFPSNNFIPRPNSLAVVIAGIWIGTVGGFVFLVAVFYLLSRMSVVK